MSQTDNSQDFIDKSLSELDIALYYTMGDVTKAEHMAAGEYKDLFVIKVKLTSPSLFGAFVLFYNYAHSSLTDLYGVISKSYDVAEISLDIDWLAFEDKISKQIKLEEHDAIILFNITKAIKEEFQFHLSKEMKNLLLANDLNTAAHNLQANVFEKKGILSSRVSLAFERISSLDMELKSKSSIKIHTDQKASTGAQDQDDQNEYEFVPLDDEDIKLYMQKRDILLVLDGTLMLAPISGMHITGLVSGDKVRVKITDKKKVAVEIARAFNAYLDGVMLPITGTIISFRHKPKGGYKIFVEIADGIFLRVDENEENIKIDFVSPSPNRPEELQENIAAYVNKYVELKKHAHTTIQTDNKPNTDKDRKSLLIFALIIFVILAFLLLLSKIF